MIDLLAPHAGYDRDKIAIRYFGAAPGEKFYEELMSQEEVRRTKELPTMFAVLPALRSFYHRIDYRYPNELPDTENRSPYISSSEAALSIKEIKAYLEEHGILKEYIGEAAGQSLPSYSSTKRQRDRSTLREAEVL
jgi:FlaA1/EpsC-like NDP-sugar epimerase